MSDARLFWGLQRVPQRLKLKHWRVRKERGIDTAEMERPMGVWWQLANLVGSWNLHEELMESPSLLTSLANDSSCFTFGQTCVVCFFGSLREVTASRTVCSGHSGDVQSGICLGKAQGKTSMAPEGSSVSLTVSSVPG